MASTTDELLGNAETYGDGFDKGGLSATPSKKVAVLACMDARLNPYGLLGLSEGEAHVIRNAGGVVSDDAIRSLAISQHLLGTEEVVVIQHTGCGLLTFTDGEFVEKLENETGQRPEWPVHTFVDLAENVRASIDQIAQSPFIPNKTSIRGFVYDVESGRLSEVV